MNAGTWLGWLIGMAVGILVVTGITVALDLSSTLAFIVGLAGGVGFSAAGMFVGTEVWDSL